MTDFGRFESVTWVSRTLSSQHCDGGALPVSGSLNRGTVSAGEDGIHDATASSMGLKTTMEFEGLSPAGPAAPVCVSSRDFVTWRKV